MLDITKLRNVLAYDPATGVFTWRNNIGNVKKDAVAGCVNRKGYRYIGIDGVLYRANRLAWAYVNGSLPKGQIDHIDGDRLNNSISNLRDVSAETNQRNRKSGNKNSTSSLLGVSYHKQSGKWRAQISITTTKHLGLFDTEQDAYLAYLNAKQKYMICDQDKESQISYPDGMTDEDDKRFNRQWDVGS